LCLSLEWHRMWCGCKGRSGGESEGYELLLNCHGANSKRAKYANAIRSTALPTERRTS